MSLPSSFTPTTCDIYRPYGAGSPTYSSIPCRLVPDFARGRGSGLAGILVWTHFIDLDDGTDILDGNVRIPGSDSLSYSDGDEVRIPSGFTTRFMVVWVERRNLGTSQAYKRAYLMRDTA